MEEIEILREEIKDLLDKADEKTIRMTHAMLEAGAEEDWWDEMNNIEKKEIDEAIAESENQKNHIPFETFQDEFKSWRKELLSSKEQSKK
jgi:hypothetical protein